MMKSLGAAVRISNGSPPASRTASFTTFAMPSRWLKQIASSDELLTTAIFGFSRSSSVSPSAFHCARRTASRGEPGSKLLLSVFVIARNLSHHGHAGDAKPRGAHALPHPKRLDNPSYWVLRPRVADALLRRRTSSIARRSSPPRSRSIKREFGASDFQLGMLTGLPFALFYSTMGIPIAAWADRWNRRNVLALAVAVWSGMTALCGMSVNFAMLFAARVGTAIGEAGGSPPSHSLISDYFPKLQRGTAFSIFALAVPIGTSLGAAIGGWGNQTSGLALHVHAGRASRDFCWRCSCALTVIEPPRGYVRQGVAARPRPPRPRACWRCCASSGRVRRSGT